MESNENFSLGKWLVHPQLNEIEHGGTVQHLGPLYMDLLVFFASHQGEVISKDRLIQAIWPDTFVTDGALSHAISDVRKALGDDAECPSYIRTIPRRGYQLIADVEFPAGTGTSRERYRLDRELGEGGMGEVWLAHDTELDRAVALKFLRAENELNDSWRRRIRHEARAAAALDHPFICKVYETGSVSGRSFIAMEYLEGEKLSSRLTKGALPLAEARKIALEIAESLEAAHRQGIIHRDLKPSNIMLTAQGHIKVMDFGLAKRISVVAGADEDRTESLLPQGAMPGTPAYMSPEQIRGQSVDARSDIFSFGIVLFEMVTGVHPFRKSTQNETVGAILHEDPARFDAFVKELPGQVQSILERVLAKDPDDRFQSIHDVRASLERLQDEPADPVGTASKQYPSDSRKGHRSWWLPVRLTVVVTVMSAIALFWWGGYQAPEPETPRIPALVPLTSYRGSETQPSLSPDGSMVAFVWNGETQDNDDIYVQVPGAPSPLRLTKHPDSDVAPAWSPDGRQIAFARLSGDSGAIYVMPALGGPERKLLDLHHPRHFAMDWSPDGKSLAYSDSTALSGVQGLYRLSLDTLETIKLTKPDGTEAEADVWPSFSPDGRMLSFRRGSAEMIPAIHLLNLERQQVRSIPLEAVGAGRDAWTADGRRLIVPARSGGLMTIDIERGTAQFIPGVSGTVRWVSRKGERLVYSREQGDTDIWQARLGESGRYERLERCIASTRLDGAPDFSPDGTRIAFGSTRSGKGQIWVFEETTGVTRQVTSVEFAGGPRWSPDGRQIAFDGITRPGARPDIFQVNGDGSGLRRLTNDPADDNLPFWSKDGRWIYFSSNRTGNWEIWRMTPEGGVPTQVTRNGGFAAQESPDGRFLYFMKGLYEPGVWRAPLAGGEETRVLDQGEPGYWGHWQIAKTGIYFSDPGMNRLVA